MTFCPSKAHILLLYVVVVVGLVFVVLSRVFVAVGVGCLMVVLLFLYFVLWRHNVFSLIVLRASLFQFFSVLLCHTGRPGYDCR